MTTTPPPASDHTPEHTPLVSVIVPAYNRASTIEKAVRSALDQTETDLEVIVVDDHSSDDTVAKVQAMQDPRITLLRHETNRGGNAARQTAIDASRGRWIAFLDSDDEWLPQKLERQLAHLAELGDDYGFCYTWYDIDLGNGSFLPAREVRAEGFRRSEFVVEHAVGTFSTMLVRSDILHQVGGVDPKLPACQDWDFVIRVNRVTGIAVVPEVLVHYWHGGGDPHRISTRKASVVEGHVAIYEQLRKEYPAMAPRDVAASREYVLAALAQQGAVAEILRMAAQTDRRCLTPSHTRFMGRMLARAGRRRLTTR